jgi:hypothetical protein
LTPYGRWAINGYSPQLGNEMSNASESYASDLLWQQARADYETTTTDLNVIAQALGISRYRLITEARKRSWKLRGTGNSSTRATIQRFKDLLQKRLAQLEGEMDVIVAEVSSAASERDIRPVNMLVRTLEKVLELERKDRAARARKRKERRKFDDAARNELAQRLMALHGERGRPLPEPQPEDGGGSPPSARLAELGEDRSATPA